MRRVSIRNQTFGFDGADHERMLTAVIVNAAPIQRTYYSEAFDAYKPQTPVCWSSNTQYPDTEVHEVGKMQATRCMDCRHNIRGGAVGGGRSCKFSQNVAIVFPADLEKVYQLRVPANSIFGRPRGTLMPLQEYARFLSKHNTVCSEIYTKVYFDDDSIVPKLFFAPTKPLKATEIDIVSAMVSHPDTLKALTLDFSKGQESFSPFEKTEGFKITG